MLNIEDMLEVMEIGDKERECGRNTDGRTVYGYYIRAKKDTLLEKVENIARGKFKLEKDPENYTQEARIVLHEKIKEYNEREDKEIVGEEGLEGYLLKSCQNKLTDIARQSKGTSTKYDSSTGEYLIVNFLSLEATDKDGNYIYEEEVTKAVDLRKEESYGKFREWFNENKKYILTKKQLEYLKNPNIIDKKNRSKINRNIISRVEKCFSTGKAKGIEVKKIKNRIDIINSILKNTYDENMILELVEKMKTENWLLEEVYTASFKTCKMVSKACKQHIYISKDGIIEIKNILHELKEFYEEIIKNKKNIKTIY